MIDPAATNAQRRILFLAHSHPFGAFRVGSHHYARELAVRGVDVVHMSTPVSLVHRATRRVRRSDLDAVPRTPQRDGDGVLYVVPRTVVPAQAGAPRVARLLQRVGVETRFDAVLIDQPLLWDDSVRALSKTVVYRPTDLYPEGLKHTLQREILRTVDGVIATSDEVLRALGTLHIPALVLGNGVDVRRFSVAARAESPGIDRCVYVGALDDRFDWARIAAWARSHPGVDFLIAGPAPRPPGSLPPNVDIVGPVPYEQVPALLQSARVGLLPLSDNPLNAGRSPMKLYEYLASGLAVVARETPGIRKRADLGVEVYAHDGDADAALDRALARPAPNRAGAHAASEEGWDRKAAALEDFLGEIRQITG